MNGAAKIERTTAREKAGRKISRIRCSGAENAAVPMSGLKMTGEMEMMNRSLVEAGEGASVSLDPGLRSQFSSPSSSAPFVLLTS